MKKLLALLGIPVIAVSLPIMVSADNKSNDRVLTGDKGEFIEVFKRDDSGGDKNYIYTISEFTDKHGRLCTVVTGDSEQTIALDCDFKSKG